MKKAVLPVELVAVLLVAGNTPATLIDRGNGSVYDSFDNLSWTQDAAISGLND